MIIIDTTGDWIRNVLGCLWERVRGRPTVFSESEERAIAPCQILDDFFRGEVEGACQGAELENTGVTVCRPGLKHMGDGEVAILSLCPEISPLRGRAYNFPEYEFTEQCPY